MKINIIGLQRILLRWDSQGEMPRLRTSYKKPRHNRYPQLNHL